MTETTSRKITKQPALTLQISHHPLHIHLKSIIRYLFPDHYVILVVTVVCISQFTCGGKKINFNVGNCVSFRTKRPSLLSIATGRMARTHSQDKLKTLLLIF